MFVFVFSIEINSERPRNQEVLSTFICVNPNNTVSQDLLIFEAWGMKQKIFVSDHLIDIRDESRCGPTRPSYYAFYTIFSKKLDKLVLNYHKARELTSECRISF